MKFFLLQLLLSIDQFINVMLLGYADETLSARAHRQRVKGQRYWGWTANFIDTLFFWDIEHCKNAYLSESLRKQLPAEFRKPS